MKTCICCGTRADDAALTCTNCGEASWSAIDVIAKIETNHAMPIEVESGTIPADLSTPAPIVDPDTSTKTPRVRRNKRPN